MPATTQAHCDQSRNLLFFTTPALWEQWPFLPLVRRKPDMEEQCGLLCDVLGLGGPTGFAATVVICNLFLVPPGLDELLALPHEVFDLPEEIFTAGWRVD